ncbi:MAG: hypothetical protein JWN04_5643 [Myxococcaceae bacterium]|nr:hypothetical protein [Myxococcaceae bacterium]
MLRRAHSCQRFIVRAVVVLLSWLGETHARAEDSWRAPAGCPDRAQAEVRLRALHADPALLARGEAAVWFDVSATGERRARVRLRHADRVEQRVLYDRSCQALADAALLVISLAFGDKLAEPEAAAARDTKARGHEPRRVQVAVAPLVRLDIGSLPSATYAVGGSLRLRVGRLIGELEGSYFGSRHGERKDPPAAGTFGLATGAVRACYALTERWLAACSALELGRESGRATHAARTKEAHGLWAAALFGLALALPTPHLSPIATLELGVPFQRPSFDVDRAGPVFQARTMIVRASLQLAFELL